MYNIKAMTENLQIIANEVASDFLNGLDSLHNLTRNVSSENNLSKHEIERVAQLANKEVQIRMYSSKGPEGAFEFDMVVPEAVINEFNVEFPDPVTEKVASSPFVYKKKFADSEKEYTGNNEFSGDFLIREKAKLEMDLETLEEELSKNAQDMEDSYKSAYKIIKQAILSEDADANEIVSFATQESEELGKIAATIASTCLGDILNQAVLPDSMIIHSDPIPVDKFEGSKSLIKELNTIVRQHDKMEVNDRGRMDIRESIRYVVEGIKSKLDGTIDAD